jgi:hypothetical protein
LQLCGNVSNGNLEVGNDNWKMPLLEVANIDSMPRCHFSQFTLPEMAPSEVTIYGNGNLKTAMLAMVSFEVNIAGIAIS